MEAIAHIRSDFPAKFGIPRQSGLVDGLKATVVFEPEFRDPSALRGLEGFSHIWLIWEFSESVTEGKWSPTVRPPRLGGNRRMGVFATRSPFRPNPIGLSCVRLESIEFSTPDGPVLHVCGADLMDGTPIYDIKPYVPVTDCHTDATEGFTAETRTQKLDVVFPAESAASIPSEDLQVLTELLSQDPRPHYQDDPERVYGFTYKNLEIRFKVCNNTLTVLPILQP